MEQIIKVKMSLIFLVMIFIFHYKIVLQEKLSFNKILINVKVQLKLIQIQSLKIKFINGNIQMIKIRLLKYLK